MPETVKPPPRQKLGAIGEGSYKIETLGDNVKISVTGIVESDEWSRQHGTTLVEVSTPAEAAQLRHFAECLGAFADFIDPQDL